MPKDYPATCKSTLLERAPDEGVKELACSVLNQAVEDWKDACQRVHASYKRNPIGFEELVLAREKTLSELRRFFNSGWCSILCADVINRSLIVKGLEAYYQQSGLAKQVRAWEASKNEPHS